MSGTNNLMIDINERMLRYFVPGMGLTICKDGQLVQGASFGVMEAGTERYITGESLFSACSISKMVTAMAKAAY